METKPNALMDFIVKFIVFIIVSAILVAIFATIIFLVQFEFGRFLLICVIALSCGYYVMYRLYTLSDELYAILINKISNKFKEKK